MFGIITGLVKATVNVVALPVAVVHDTITLGGALTDRKQPMTADCLENIVDAVDEACDTKK